MSRATRSIKAQEPREWIANPNHQLAAYQAAIDKEVETSELPIDPFSSF